LQIENAKKIKGQYFFPALQKVLEKLKELEARYAKQNACAAKQNEICEICGGMQDKTRVIFVFSQKEKNNIKPQIMILYEAVEDTYSPLPLLL
jgi:recombinational DNA repair protein RecR